MKKQIDGDINVEVQFHLKKMADYCLKETNFIAEEYSGRISKEHWKVNFSERKPHFKKVLENFLEWQKFVKEQILMETPEDRIVDWIIDPEGNTGKSSFARAYVSDSLTDGL